MSRPTPRFTDSKSSDSRAAAEAPILFIHLPKAAGTSMRHSLEAALGSANVYPSADDFRSRGDSRYPKAWEILRDYASIRPYRVLIGHFPAGLKDALPVPHRTAVILRNPVQRSLSLLAHLARHGGTSPQEVLASDTLRQRLVDMQTRMMAARIGTGMGEVTDATLEQAIHNLDTFDFVGLTERFADSCRLFDVRFGTRVADTMRQSNVLRPGGRGFEEFIPLVEPLVARDRVLYERARARFEKDLAAAVPAAAEVRRRAA